MKEVTFKGNEAGDQFVTVDERTYDLGVAVVVTEDEAKALDDLEGFSIKESSTKAGAEPVPPSTNPKT